MLVSHSWFVSLDILKYLLETSQALDWLLLRLTAQGHDSAIMLSRRTFLKNLGGVDLHFIQPMVNEIYPARQF